MTVQFKRVQHGAYGYDVGLSGRALLTAVTICCSLGFLLVGYDNGVMGGVIDTAAFDRTFKDPSAATTGNIVSLYEIGCFLGAMSTFVIGKPFGRRRAIMFGAVWMVVGAIIQAASTSVGVMILGRVVCGLGMGIINSTVGVLQAEMSPAISRGQLIAIDLVILNCGIVLSYWIDYGFNYSGLTGNVTWRVPLALQCVFILGIFLVACIIPDTPRWYATVGRNDEARTVLARLRGKDEDDVQVQAEFEDIVNAMEHERATEAKGWKALIAPGGGWKDDNLRTRRRLLLACFIQVS